MTTMAAHSSSVPLPVQLLSQRGWPPAAQFFWARIADIEGVQLGDLASDYWSRDKGRCKDACHTLANLLFAAGHGTEGLAALMLAADPCEPMTFEIVLPQLAYAIEHLWDFPADGFARQHALRRLAVWWRAARGDFKDNAASIFWLTRLEVLGGDASEEPTPAAEPNRLAQEFVPEAPGIIVMPSSMSTKLNNYHSEFKDLLDARLPLRLARNVDAVRKTLIAEYPHATTAIDLLLRGLREGKPVLLPPTLVTGPVGVGKSRLIRRLFTDHLGIGVFSYDGSGASDNMYSGSPKGWGNTTPSAPARAVNQARIANPVVLVEEIDKAAGGTSSRNGRLWDCLLPYLERETASRIRDVSLDCVLDLSGCLHLATANSIEDLPDPLRDRYRIIRVPAPRLADLPQLAANVMQELAVEAGEQGFVWPLAKDELAVIGRAWDKAGFSLRNLRRIMVAVVEVRNITAVRH
jgi:ATP-dependent Lon protease